MSVPVPARAFAPGLWLSLAIILIHALAPSATPWRISYGSAFNGFTRDVSLGPSRTSPVEKDQRARERRDDRGGLSGDRLAAARFASRAEPRLAPHIARFAFDRTDVLPASRFVGRNRAREPPSL